MREPLQINVAAHSCDRITSLIAVFTGKECWGIIFKITMLIMVLQK